MSDIDKTIENEFRETDGSGAEGVILGCKMFDEFRVGIVASLPKDLSEEEFKKELFREDLRRVDGRLPERRSH